MPIGAYFKGHGNAVMDSMMKSNHGDTKAATSEFYATANARGAKPGMSMKGPVKPKEPDADDKKKQLNFGRLKPPGR